jgi:hypothetical protein
VATTKYRRTQPFLIYLSVAEAVVVFMLFLDPVLAITKSSLSGGVYIRFGVPFRPILVILWSGRIKEIISEVLEACRSLKFMAILTLAWLCISSMLLVLNARGECGYGDGNREYLYPSNLKQSCKTLMRYFDNSLVGVVAAFVLLTGEIYSSVTLALFDIPGQSFVFIVVAVWTLISYFVLLALVLAIIFNAYKDAKRATLVYQSDSLDGCLIDAFETIANPQSWTIEFDVYAKFIQCLQVIVLLERCALFCLAVFNENFVFKTIICFVNCWCSQPGISSKTVRLYWKNHDKVKVISPYDLLSLFHGSAFQILYDQQISIHDYVVTRFVRWMASRA